METSTTASAEDAGIELDAGPLAVRPEDRQAVPEERKSPPNPRVRARALLEVLLCTDLPAALIVPSLLVRSGFRVDRIFQSSAQFALLRLSYCAFILATIFLLVRLRRESLRTLLRFDAPWRREAIAGLAVVPFLFAATGGVGLFFRAYFPEMVTTENPILALIKTPWDTVWFLATAIVAGGLEEEVQRAFVLRRFEKYLGGIYAGLVVWTLYFGAGHWVQGFDNAVGAGMLGLLFGLTYIWRQNLVAPIVAHAAYDTVVVVLYSIFGVK